MIDRPFSSCSTSATVRRQSLRTALLLAASWAAVVALPGCGSSPSPSSPGTVTPTPTPVPTPTPAPTPVPQSAACRLTAPTVDCSTHAYKAQELAPALQAAVDAAVGAPGTMYADNPKRLYYLDQFRSITLDRLTAAGVCGAFDWGDEMGVEIYLRSADGCEIEQYGLIGSDGGVRPPGKKTNLWSSGWGEPVPPPKPQYARDGDLACTLPGDRSTFCFSIKFTPGEYGPAIYALLVEVMNENPQLFDKNDIAAGQGQFNPDELRVAGWRILDQDAYIAAIETKIRSRGFCGYVDKGDILKVKSLAKGNIFHEEMDIVQNPASGGAYAIFVVKDRCHNAGF